MWCHSGHKQKCVHTCIHECGQVWLSVSNGSNKIHPHQEDRRHPNTLSPGGARRHNSVPCDEVHTHTHTPHTAGHSLFSVQRMTSSSHSPLTHRPQGQLSLAGSPPLPLSLAPQPATPLLFQGTPQKDRSPAPPGGILGLLQVGSTHARAHGHAQADVPAAAAPSAGHSLRASQVIPQSPAGMGNLLCAYLVSLFPASLLLE